MRLETLTLSLARRYAVVLAALSPLLPFSATQAADIPASPVNLTWNPNPETDIAGYKVHFGTASGNYTQVIDVAGQNHAELPQLILGNTYYLAVSAYNTAGQEGPRSSEFRLSAAPPSPTEGTSFSMGSTPGNGKLSWKHPKTAALSNGPAEGFAVYGSEDLVTWTVVKNVGHHEATRSDAQYVYFEWPYTATRSKMFFKVGAGNAFGETK